MGSDRQLLPGGGDHIERSLILGNLRQRRVLSILLDQSHPMTVRDLAVQLTAREDGIAPTDVTEEDHRPIRVDLHHRCLPKLEAAGWIERHPEGVIAAEQLPFGDGDSSLPDLRDPDHPSWEAVSALLERPRRQDLVSVIADQRHGLSVEELALEVTERDRTSWAPETRADETALLCTLHHVDLPRIAAAGLIEYDRDEKMIARTPALMALANRMDLGDGRTEDPDSD